MSNALDAQVTQFGFFFVKGPLFSVFEMTGRASDRMAGCASDRAPSNQDRNSARKNTVLKMKMLKYRVQTYINQRLVQVDTKPFCTVVFLAKRQT